MRVSNFSTDLKKQKKKQEKEGNMALSASYITSATSAGTSKLSFRARQLDVARPMRIYLSDEIPDLDECTPINRAVAQMPTGMEKDEEMVGFNFFNIHVVRINNLKGSRVFLKSFGSVFSIVRTKET